MNGFEQLHEYILSWTDAGQWQKSEEIVRCEGCKFFREDELGVFCTWFDFEDVDEERQRDGFCAWGVRRGDVK